MAKVIGDPSFGLKSQALMVLAQLSKEEPNFAPYNQRYSEYEVQIDSYPMYNGRETGVCLVVQRGWMGNPREDALHIFFAEHRNSDGIRFWIWKERPPFNNPVLPFEKHEKGEIELDDVTVGFGRVDSALRLINDRCKDFFEGYEPPPVDE